MVYEVMILPSVALLIITMFVNVIKFDAILQIYATGCASACLIMCGIAAILDGFGLMNTEYALFDSILAILVPVLSIIFAFCFAVHTCSYAPKEPVNC